VITAATILDSASTTLLDTAHRTWPEDELIGYLNEALRATAFVKPDIYTLEIPFALAAGIIQTLPADGTALIDVPRNSPAGRVVTQVDKSLQDEAYRFWPSATQEPTVEHFTADPRNPLRFSVFPPNDGTGVVDLVYGAVPPQINYAAEEMSVPDSYEHILVNFVLGKAYEKNTKRQDLTKASGYIAQWRQLLGLKSQAQIAVSPHVASSPGTT
jgi:hypothetical protein